MSGRVNVRYGLNQGDRIMVTRGKEKKKAAVLECIIGEAEERRGSFSG